MTDTRIYRTELEQPSACGGRWGLYVDGRLIARTRPGTGPRRRASLGVQPTRGRRHVVQRAHRPRRDLVLGREPRDPTRPPRRAAMTDTERAATLRLASRWENAADNLEAAITDGAPRHPDEVTTLRECADELRRTLRMQRPGAQA